MTRRWTAWGLLLPSLVLAGCPEKVSTSQEPSASVPAAPASSAPTVSAAAASSNAAPTEPPPPPLPTPPEKGSLAPTPIDWKKAPKVEIAHARALGCDAYMIREWIQVVCKEGPTTDRPERVEVLRDDGAKKRVFARASDGRVSLVLALRRGVDAEIVFHWRTPGWGTRKLIARYQESDARPSVAFDRGAPGAEESPITLAQAPGEKPHVGRMLPVPAGARKDKAPVKAFLLDETEVTFWAWQACVEAGACPQPSGSLGCARSVEGVDPLRPIHCVTFEEAGKYCAWAGKRLPTEQEWWYAFYGSDGRTYPWGNQTAFQNVCDYQEHQWVKPDGKSRLLDLGCKVGSHPAGRGPFGHEDLLSNVAEWTVAEEDGKRVVLGASFGTVSGASEQENWAGLMQTMREKYPPDTREPGIGFRCAR